MEDDLSIPLVNTLCAQQRQRNQSNFGRPTRRMRRHCLARLNAENAKLHAQVDEMSAGLRTLNIRIATAEADLQSTIEGREALTAERDATRAQRDALETQLESVQDKLAKSEAGVAGARQEIAKLRDRFSDTEATLLVNRMKIRDLTDQLTAKSAAFDQEHQLLAVGHDVTDLMGARNLHIVDVVDTDPRGKTRPAFGRVFFTEGKSLIFYAYDLNDARIEKANYQYRVWAKKEGSDKQVRNLGIFYSDDKAQRRWAFKCTDPKILNEIDSVFVTLEPAGDDPVHPRGQNLMYAYLRGQPNHP
jgi:DNA repair exonuclease SbcCD ATPase subunit